MLRINALRLASRYFKELEICPFINDCLKVKFYHTHTHTHRHTTILSSTQPMFMVERKSYVCLKAFETPLKIY